MRFALLPGLLASVAVLVGCSSSGSSGGSAGTGSGGAHPATTATGTGAGGTTTTGATTTSSAGGHGGKAEGGHGGKAEGGHGGKGGAGGKGKGGGGGSGGVAAGGGGPGGNGGADGGLDDGNGSGGGGDGGLDDGSGSGGGEGGPGDGGAGAACAFGDACGQGLYCNAPGCGAGTCTATGNLASIPAKQKPVCGCDNGTYWNPETAAWQGMSVKSDGACPAGNGIVCGPGVPCPGTLKCDRQAGDGSQCAANPGGVCWGMPLFCAANGPAARGCINGTCSDICSLISSQNPWYDDGTCP